MGKKSTILKMIFWTKYLSKWVYIIPKFKKLATFRGICLLALGWVFSISLIKSRFSILANIWSNQTFHKGCAPLESLITLGTSLEQIFPGNSESWTLKPTHTHGKIQKKSTIQHHRELNTRAGSIFNKSFSRKMISTVAVQWVKTIVPYTVLHWPQP